MDVKIERSDVSGFLWLQNIVEDAIVDHLTERWKNIYFSREKDYHTWLFEKTKYKSVNCPLWESEHNRFRIANAHTLKVSNCISVIDRESLSIDFDKKEKLFTIHYREYAHIPSSEKEFVKTQHGCLADIRYNYVDSTLKITLGEIFALLR